MPVSRKFTLVLGAAVAAFFFGAGRSSGQGAPDPAALMTAQRDAMKRLAFMDGQWRGPASITLPNGQKHTVTQTERVGPMLDGTIRVVEGRGYEADGKTAFNALAVVSYDPAKKSYSLRSYAQGRSGDFTLTPTERGVKWEIEAGPMTIRYTAEIADGKWHEIGERILPGRDPIRFHEMTLTRIGDTKWPSADAVPPQ